MLPAAAQAVIWREYREGQERSKTPSARYSIAEACAVAFVALRTGRYTHAQALTHVEGRLLLLVANGRIDDADELAAALRICCEMGVEPSSQPMLGPKKTA
jgi:hypothetical protein